jgi:hypothetical protein
VTALTWEQARRKMECDCLDRNATVCALLNELNHARCPCACHGYLRDEKAIKVVGTEGRA